MIQFAMFMSMMAIAVFALVVQIASLVSIVRNRPSTAYIPNTVGLVVTLVFSWIAFRLDLIDETNAWANYSLPILIAFALTLMTSAPLYKRR